MSNLLFTEVSVEVQETVAGGAFAFSGSIAQYLLQATNTNAALAGPGGAGAGSSSTLNIGSLAANLTGLSL